MNDDLRNPTAAVAELAAELERGLPLPWLRDHGKRAHVAAIVLEQEPGRFAAVFPAEPQHREALEAAGLKVIVRQVVPTPVVIDQAALGVVEGQLRDALDRPSR